MKDSRFCRLVLLHVAFLRVLRDPYSKTTGARFLRIERLEDGLLSTFPELVRLEVLGLAYRVARVLTGEVAR